MCPPWLFITRRMREGTARTAAWTTSQSSLSQAFWMARSLGWMPNLVHLPLQDRPDAEVKRIKVWAAGWPLFFARLTSPPASAAQWRPGSASLGKALAWLEARIQS